LRMLEGGEKCWGCGRMFTYDELLAFCLHCYGLSTMKGRLGAMCTSCAPKIAAFYHADDDEERLDA